MAFWNKAVEYDHVLWEIKVWIDTDKLIKLPQANECP